MYCAIRLGVYDQANTTVTTNNMAPKRICWALSLVSILKLVVEEFPRIDRRGDTEFVDALKFKFAL